MPRLITAEDLARTHMYGGSIFKRLTPKRRRAKQLAALAAAIAGALVAAHGPGAVRRARAENQFRKDVDQIAAIQERLGGLTGKDIESLLSG